MKATESLYAIFEAAASGARLYDSGGYFRGYQQAENITLQDLDRATRIEFFGGGLAGVVLGDTEAETAGANM